MLYSSPAISNLPFMVLFKCLVFQHVNIKTMRIFRHLLILLCAFLIKPVMAQQDFRPGYVILNSGDTLKGEIDYRADYFMGLICTFRENTNAPKRKFTADSIMAYRFTNSKYFVSENIKTEGSNENKRVFLEYLIKGALSVYYLRDDNGDHYYINKKGYNLLELPYSEQLVFDKSVNGYNYIRSTKHIDRLNYYTKDAPSLKPEIEKTTEPDRRDLIKIATDYNNAVCKDTACVIFNKPPVNSKINPEFVLGYWDFNTGASGLTFAKFRNESFIVRKNYPLAGLLLHFKLSDASEKLYFKSGIFASQIEYTTNQTTLVLKIPMHFEYQYPKGPFRPNFSFGPNFYVPGAVTFSICGGARIKLYKKAFLNLGAELDGLSGLYLML